MKRSDAVRVQIHFSYVCEQLYLSAVLFRLRRSFLFGGRGLFGWLPKMLFEIHAKFDERDTFTFEKSSLKQGVRAANEDFAAVTDHAVPRNALSGGSCCHGASGRARATWQTQSFGQPSVS